MFTAHAISELPNVPAVYGLYGGTDGARYLAYIGVAEKLKQRISQHLVRRDSSIVTGVAVVSLNPEHVTEVRWWEHDDFGERSYLEAAELVAFDVLNPVLRSRGPISARLQSIYGDDRFQATMRDLFVAEPSGIFTIPTLSEALDRIAELEHRLAALEKKLSES